MKILKRITALFLATTFATAVMPLNSAFANIQSNINNLSIANVPMSSSSASNVYGINLSWEIPNAWSTVIDGSAINGSQIHEPYGYKVQGFDMTTNKGSYLDIDSVAGANTTSATETRVLENGRFYAYRVLPYHYHTTDEGSKIVEPDKTKAENVLYMTDISVDATISGGKLTVTWDDPKIKGTRVFDKYKIYYIRGDNPALITFNDGSTQVDVPVDNAKSVDSDTRLSYTITDDEIVDGEYYAVKVEPMYENKIFRDLSTGSSYKTIKSSNINYKTTFRSIETNEYRTVASSKIKLSYVEEGSKYINLHWSSISNTTGNIKKIEVVMYDAQELTEAEKKPNAEKVEYGDATNEENVNYKYYLFNNESVIGTINSTSATYINNWKTEKPSKLKGYKIKVYVDGKQEPIESNYVILPEPTVIAPNKPDLYLNYNKETKAIDVSWKAFLRYPFTEEEEKDVNADGMYTDCDVVYDIWVTDKFSNFTKTNMSPIVENYTVSSSDLVEVGEKGEMGFVMPITSFYTLNSEEALELVNGIKGNKNYYVKLIAKNGVNTSYSSDAVYATIYITTDEDISTPASLSKPPLEIVDNATTIDTLKIQWDSKWFEIYDESTDTWYSEVSAENGTLLFGDNADKENLIKFYNAINEERAREILKQADIAETVVDSLLMRKIDLSKLELEEDIKYELVCKSIDDVSGEGGYTEYVKKLIKDDATDWVEITPQTDAKHHNYTISPLDANKTYVIILRPYRISESGEKEAYPAYVVGSTIPEPKNPDITPTVPILQQVEVGDTHFVVKWEEHIPNLDYEIAINETNLDDPSKASVVSDMAGILENGKKYPENGLNYFEYTANNLFPDTGYYVWIRSIANNQNETISSVWSAPLYIETNELEPPEPPTGLGPISQSDIAVYNRADSTSYIPIDYNYFIVQWNRNYYDTNDIKLETKSGTNFSVFDNEEIKNRYAVLFNNLLPNTEYYVRAKAVHIVKRGSDKKSESLYSYVVQVAPTDDFKDAVEAVVPIAIPEQTTTGDKVYVIESEWCDEIKLFTEPSDTEYDADKNPDLYPLPTEDYELIYEGSLGNLVYRFRSNEEDMDGNDDNGVDQRFISRLIENKTFTYTVDLTSYNGNFIKSRTIEIPYSIIAAFDERKINFQVVANNMTVTFPPEFLRTNEVINRYDYGIGTKVKLVITEKPDNMPVLNYNQSYISVPQSIKATVETPTTIINVKNTAKPVTIALKTENRYSAIDSNVSAYTNDSEADKLWNRVNATYDNATGTYNFTTGKLETYCALAVAAPTAMGTDQSAKSNIATFQSRLNITDIASFNPQKVVSVVEFNNIIAAIAMGKKDVQLNSALSTEEYTALSRKGILVNGSVVSRQQAVKSLIALYEAKTKTRVYNYSTLETTPYADIKNADPIYRTAMLKAGDLGFFETSNGARPKDVLGLNELIYMTNIILEDCNY